ncbi:DUF3085 domain-containing protein, partial [Streptomyces viridochromogenes]|uniref:DUF3085 domain-containing protein n=1 Tax=Streptomyces viridochromogenes TaxID=1938 RepID=UPI00117BFF00
GAARRAGPPTARPARRAAPCLAKHVTRQHDDLADLRDQRQPPAGRHHGQQPRGEKNCTLVFPLDRVLAAAEHAAAADTHKLGYGETEAARCLWWVKDDGTYLMSNGQDPTGTRDDNGRLPHVVHADGWGPGTDARSVLAGDDFRESLDLATPVFEDGTTLLGMLREASTQGATRFVLKATFDDTSMELTYITE